MTVAAASYPYPLGGGGYGQHWSAAQAAYSSAVAQAHIGSLGTLTANAQSESRKAAHRAIENAGIVAGEIIGWRVWRAVGDRLHSVVISGCEWKPGEAVTGDVVGAGVHAFKHMADAENEYRHYTLESPLIVGRVALWGEVVEHENGYRAEFGEVESLEKVIPHEPWAGVPSITQVFRNKQKESARLLERLRAIYVIDKPSFEEAA